MKRDMNVIRRIALETESLPPGGILFGLDGVDEQTFAVHLVWMAEAGLIKAKFLENKNNISDPAIFRLTWAGCEFADAARDPTIWDRTLAILKPVASFTFDILKECLKAEALKNIAS
ncbi:MAG: DUF2513 domain-containing protein [Zoogloeaceae bacterium]|jgi:hypothetical protein|nr:DUF2513 domain-containing protein [Zoogloeaceae bacterium]